MSHKPCNGRRNAAGVDHWAWGVRHPRPRRSSQQQSLQSTGLFIGGTFFHSFCRWFSGTFALALILVLPQHLLKNVDLSMGITRRRSTLGFSGKVLPRLHDEQPRGPVPRLGVVEGFGELFGFEKLDA